MEGGGGGNSLGVKDTLNPLSLPILLNLMLMQTSSSGLVNGLAGWGGGEKVLKMCTSVQ